MIPPCRLCNGAENAYCARCQGSQLDQAWNITLAPERDGYTRLRLAYGAHGATRPIADEVVDNAVADLLADIVGGENRRGLILRDKRPAQAVTP